MVSDAFGSRPSKFISHKDRWILRGLHWALSLCVGVPMAVVMIAITPVLLGWIMPDWMFYTLAFLIPAWMIGCTLYGHRCIERAYGQQDPYT